MGVGFALKEAEHNSGQGWPSKAEAERWAEKVRKYDERKITVVKDGEWWRIHYGPELNESSDPFKYECGRCDKKFASQKMDPKCPKCGKTDQVAPASGEGSYQKEGFLSPDFECLECGKVFRSRSLEPRCPKCGGYDIDIAKGTIKESGWGDGGTIRKHHCRKCFSYWMGPSDDVECPKCGANEYSVNQTNEELKPTTCKKCGKVSTFKADGWCKDCWDKDDLKEEAEKLLCHDCGTVFMGDFPAKCPECGCRKCVTTDEPLSEEYALTTYFTGNDKDGWVLIHQGQPLNANPQGGIPVSRERVQKVAKQFGFKDVMVWNGKNYTYSFGESTETKCTQCKKPLNPVQALMGSVCGECTRKNHAAATKGFDKAYEQARKGK